MMDLMILINVFPLDDLCRDAAHESAFRHIAIHQRAGGYYGVVADPDAWQDGSVRADHYVLAYHDLSGPVRLDQILVARMVGL